MISSPSDEIACIDQLKLLFSFFLYCRMIRAHYFNFLKKDGRWEQMQNRKLEFFDFTEYLMAKWFFFQNHARIRNEGIYRDQEYLEGL